MVIRGSRSPQLKSLQALRGIAATAVVVHHALLIGTDRFPTIGLDAQVRPSAAVIQALSIGVDIFFVLSGFLMVWISGPYVRGTKTAGHFMQERILRIWPMYALMTTVTCLRLAWEFGKTGVLPYDLQPDRLLGYLFIPSFNVEGRLQPILVIGWTLIYEMLFYLCFACVIATGRRFLLVNLTLLLAGLFLIAPWLPALWYEFLGNPILFEFVIGAGIATVLRAPGSANRSAVLAIAGLSLCIVAMVLAGHHGDRLVAMGLPAAILFILFFMLETRTVFPRWLLQLGNASYSLYLVHIMVMYPVLGRLSTVLAGHSQSAWMLLVAAGCAIIASIVAGLITYRFLERPITRFLQRKTRAHDPQAGMTSPTQG